MIEFKFVVFFFCFFVGVPVGIYLSARFQFIERIVFFLSILFTARMSETINFISREFYRGTSRGFEITLVDLLVLVLLGNVLIKKDFKDLVFIPKGFLLLGGFIFMSFLSLMNSDNLLYSSFELLKLARMSLFLWVLTNYIDSKEKLKHAALNIAGVITYIFFVVLYDKYVLHIFQAKGPFPHQNSMVMYTIIFGSIMFSVGLFMKMKDSLIYIVTLLMSVIIVISSLSRAGMFFFFLSLGIIFFVKIVSSPSKKDFVTFIGGFIMLGLILLKASDSIIERFQTAPKESQEVRVMLAKAALKMADDKLFGIGLNNFGLKINYPYPYSKGTPHYYDPDFRGGLVETSYLMVAAESGWIGLFAYVLMLLRMLLLNVIMYFRARAKETKMISLGIIGGLIGIYLESTLEWVLRQTTNFYQLMLIFALINCFHRLLKQSKNKKVDCESLKETDLDIPPIPVR